jgi:alpha-glucosidase
MKNVVRFWYDLGVDGLRVDAIWGISKDPDLADDPINPNYHYDLEQYGSYIHNKCKYGPNFDQYLGELASINDEYDDRQIVFEFYPDEQLGDVYGQYQRVMNINQTASAFFMEYRQNNWHADHTKYSIAEYLGRKGQAIPFFCIGNHDQPRVASRLGPERARALSFMNLLTPGISVVYYGDELGMENGDLSERDIQDSFSPSHTKFDSRDLERTPMQWDDSQFAGFSTVEPWLPVNANRSHASVMNQSMSEDSPLLLHRRLLHLRQAVPALRHGDLQCIDTGNGYIVAFERSLDGEKYIVLINFADQPQTAVLEQGVYRIVTATEHNAASFASSHSITLAGYGGVMLTSET